MLFPGDTDGPATDPGFGRGLSSDLPPPQKSIIWASEYNLGPQKWGVRGARTPPHPRICYCGLGGNDLLKEIELSEADRIMILFRESEHAQLQIACLKIHGLLTATIFKYVSYCFTGKIRMFS